MPHKRAKRSVREQQRSARIVDQDPTPSLRNIQDEAIPKSVSRILNAAQIRANYSLSKRKREEGEDTEEKRANSSKKQRKNSLAKESLSQFNRRAEDNMDPLFKSAMQSSSYKTKAAAPKQQKTKQLPEQNPPLQAAPTRPSDFEKKSSSAPRRLNDIVSAPPQLDKVFRGSSRVQKNTEDGRGSSVISMAQKVMMETERENAIQRYRELKERRLKEHLPAAD